MDTPPPGPSLVKLPTWRTRCAICAYWAVSHGLRTWQWLSFFRPYLLFSNFSFSNLLFILWDTQQRVRRLEMLQELSGPLEARKNTESWIIILPLGGGIQGTKLILPKPALFPQDLLLSRKKTQQRLGVREWYFKVRIPGPPLQSCAVKTLPS